MTTVREIPRPQATPVVTFTFAPTSGGAGIAINGTTYNSSGLKAAINTVITFTATVTFAVNTEWVVAYEWDFGDGVVGYGNPATHTYKAANLHNQAVVTVIDNLGRRTQARKQIYLIP